MRARTRTTYRPTTAIGDAVATGIAWLPFLALAVAVGLLFLVGLTRLENLKGATNFTGVNPGHVDHSERVRLGGQPVRDDGFAGFGS